MHPSQSPGLLHEAFSFWGASEIMNRKSEQDGAAGRRIVNNITLNLVVLRSPDIARAVAFYTQLGFHFTRHRHGSGPEHFAAELPGGVFELYPLAPDGPSTLGTRIGFRVPSTVATGKNV